MAKYRVESLDAVPEPLRGEYEAVDGMFRLKIDGGLDTIPDHLLTKTKLAEFRDTNRNKENELVALRSQLDARKDIDPEKYKQALDKLAELEKVGVKGTADVKTAVDEALARVVKENVDPLRVKLEASETKAREAQERLNKAKLREVIGGAVLKAGARPDAVDYLLQKAEKVFTVEELEVKALPNQYSPTKVTEPISVDEWVASLPKEHGFAFATSVGGGANSGKGVKDFRPGDKVLITNDPRELGKMSIAIGKGEVKLGPPPTQ